MHHAPGASLSYIARCWCPGRCRALNVPTHLVSALEQQRAACGVEALLVHLSTDQVRRQLPSDHRWPHARMHDGWMKHAPPCATLCRCTTAAARLGRRATPRCPSTSTAAPSWLPSSYCRCGCARARARALPLCLTLLVRCVRAAAAVGACRVCRRGGGAGTFATMLQQALHTSKRHIYAGLLVMAERIRSSSGLTHQRSLRWLHTVLAAVQDRWPKHVILRSSIIYGRTPPYAPVPRQLFLQFIDGALQEGKPVTFFHDEFRNPVYVRDIVRVAARLCELAGQAGPAAGSSGTADGSSGTGDGCSAGGTAQQAGGQCEAGAAGDGTAAVFGRVFNMGGPDRLSRVDMAHKVWPGPELQRKVTPAAPSRGPCTGWHGASLAGHVVAHVCAACMWHGMAWRRQDVVPGSCGLHPAGPQAAATACMQAETVWCGLRRLHADAARGGACPTVGGGGARA